MWCVRLLVVSIIITESRGGLRGCIGCIGYSHDYTHCDTDYSNHSKDYATNSAAHGDSKVSLGSLQVTFVTIRYCLPKNIGEFDFK